MKLRKPGKNISKVSVLNISEHGIWIELQKQERFLPFSEFPWFKEAKLADIQNVELHHQKHLHWPNLDIDLHIDSLNSLEKFSLIAKQ